MSETRVCKGPCGLPLPLIKFDKAPRSTTGGRRHICRKCRGSKQSRAAAPRADKPPRFTRPLDSVRYIITSAQNATEVHAEFLGALQTYARETGAELVVIPLRYKNPTSLWTMRQQDQEWWDPEVVRYLFNTRKKLCDNLVLVGDVKTQPTAGNPLSGFEALTGAESCIIGHPKMQLKVVPAPTSRMPKILSTTGSVTKRNYTDTKAGKVGAFHHFLGAVVVEITGKKFHLRQVNADREDGSFIDLDRVYSARGVRPAPPALALVMGDTHARFTDPAVDRATFGPGGMVEALNPETLVWHDLFDGYSVNPHHAGNPFIAQAKYRGKFTVVRAEIEHAVKWVADRAKGRKAVIIPSNHDNFLSRWVVNTDWRTTPPNAAFYLETAAAMLRSTKLTAHGAEYDDPFRYWVNRLKGRADIRALRVDESFKVGGVECGMHGDRGPNGGPGSMKGFARLGARVITGHSHTPGIEEGHYQVGTSTPLRLEYTHGPSSWLNTHCVVYANGKRSLLTVVDGAWRVPASKSPHRRAA